MGKSKRRYYLIDTENVGDRWLELPEKLKKKEKVITFYTENHSKHMEKFFMKQAHNPKIQWLECATGSNALDYQLIGVLSYLIAQHPKAAFCIFSNDKDYQTTIDFWKSRNIEITQKGFETNKKKSKKKKDKKKKSSASNSNTPSAPSKKAASSDKAAPSGKAASPNCKGTEEDQIIEIARSLPTSDLNGWYNILTVIFGQERGREWYRKFRQDAQWRKSLSQHCVGDARTRSIRLVQTVFNFYGFEKSHAEDAYKIIHSHGFKDLSAIKVSFDRKFGARTAQSYYRSLRPLVKVLKKI